MSYSYQRVERRQVNGRSYLGYWLPFALTATVATVGIVAWIWNERRDGEESDYDYDRDERPTGDRDAKGPPSYQGARPAGPSISDLPTRAVEEGSVTNVMSRVSGAIRRTPSPQQLLDGASKRVAAGVAAAGAVVGGALSSIREESTNREGYEDHSRWSEEAELHKRSGRPPPLDDGARAGGLSSGAASHGRTASTQYQSAARRKTVAVVVSADVAARLSDDEHHEDASILSHLPAHVDTVTSRLFVLIYSPELKQDPAASSTSNLPTASVTSSYSNIGLEEAREGEKGDFDAETSRSSTGWTGRTPAFDAIYSQATAMVEKETMILPFTTPSGHVHMLRHLAPEIVYIQESLTGDDGEVVKHISGWVGEVVVVVGAEGGHGGLIDSDDDQAQTEEQLDKWWQRSERVGLGKGVEVVESMRVAEHWARRLGGQE